LPDPNTGSTGGYTTPNISVGVTQLPINPPVTAIAGGSYPNVFNNAQVDGNFGVTSPIYLGQITPTGKTVSTTDLTALTGITTSFPSKSEMALNLSTNRNALTDRPLRPICDQNDGLLLGHALPTVLMGRVNGTRAVSNEMGGRYTSCGLARPPRLCSRSSTKRNTQNDNQILPYSRHILKPLAF